MILIAIVGIFIKDGIYIIIDFQFNKCVISHIDSSFKFRLKSTLGTQTFVFKVNFYIINEVNVVTVKNTSLTRPCQ